MAPAPKQSPTFGKPEGTPLAVRAYLVGHGPAGQPAITLKSDAGPLSLIWIDPSAIIDVGGADAETGDDGRPVYVVGGAFTLDGPPTRFNVFGPNQELLQSGFTTPELAARWAVENDPDAIVRLNDKTAEALGRDETDRVLRS